MFGHERFTAYQYSIEFLSLALKLLTKLPRGNAYMSDQLKRAAMSVPLNLAEGSGKKSQIDKIRFYTIARGSAMECAAACDVILLIDPRLEKDVFIAKSKLEEVTKILTAICYKK